MLVTTSLGLRSCNTGAPMPMRSRSPALKFSMTTSARSTRSRSTSIPAGIAEIQLHTLLVAVDVVEVAAGIRVELASREMCEAREPGRVGSVLRFDLDDASAMVGKDARRVRPGEHPCEVEHDDAVERASGDRPRRWIVRTEPVGGRRGGGRDAARRPAAGAGRDIRGDATVVLDLDERAARLELGTVRDLGGCERQTPRGVGGAAPRGTARRASAGR